MTEAGNGEVPNVKKIISVEKALYKQSKKKTGWDVETAEKGNCFCQCCAINTVV